MAPSPIHLVAGMHKCYEEIKFGPYRVFFADDEV